MNRNIIFSVLVICSFIPFQGQNLENIKKQDPLKISGYLSTNQVVNFQSTNQADTAIYSGYYTGSLNFNIYDISIPLTFIYTNRKTNFSHPFNQYGIHPSYKWIRGHLGYASMTFSPYTLNGHLFLGAGIEADPPGMFRISAMYGQLRKAVDFDTSDVQSQPSYKRIGYGIKVGLTKENDNLDFILFRAHDVFDPGYYMLDSLQIFPMENSVASLCLGKTFIQKLSFTAEYSASAMTQDKRTEFESPENGFVKPTSWFMRFRTTTILRNAFKANASYNFGKYSLGLGYERIDPEYTTLGSYYFTNNLENTTINFAANFFDSKLNLSGNTGIQRDNLEKSKMNNTKRVVGAINASIVPGEKLNLNFSYSNFLSYTNVRSTFDYINQTDPLENYDTLNFRQISQNINTNCSYQISANKEKRQSLSLNMNYQVSDDQSDTDTTEKSHFYNVNTSYIFGLVPQSLNITTSINYNRNEVTEANTSTWGPSININKMFFDKKFRSAITFSYNTSSINGESSGNIVNLRLGSTYTVKKQHNFNLNVLYQIRNQKNENVSDNKNRTATVTFAYLYNFNILQSDKPNTISNKNE